MNKEKLIDAEYVIDQIREMASDNRTSKADIRWFIDKYRNHPEYIRNIRRPNQFRNKFHKTIKQEK